MSEIKFACPHCDQHIECDDLYCGEKIACPGCNGLLFVPPLAAFIPLQSGKMSLAPPVAAKEKIEPHPARLEPWTEAQWEEHEARTTGASQGAMLPFWALLVVPLAIALLLVVRGVGANRIMLCFGACAVVAGFYLARLQEDSVVGTIAKGILYSIGVVMVYVVLAVGLLFLGCLALA